MQLTWVDHLFVLALITYFPIDGWRVVKRLERDVAAGKEGARLRHYRRTMLDLWVSAILVVGYCAIQGRSWTDLGFALPQGKALWIGAGVVGISLVALFSQARAISSSDDVPASLQEVDYLLPHTAQESRSWSALSVTAGLCEEVIFRGYLLAYFGTWFGWPVALLLSSLVFGLAHSYQGAAGIAKTGLVGAGFAMMFRMSGALWAPMIVHAAMDWTAGVVASRAYGNRNGGPTGPPVVDPLSAGQSDSA